MRVSERHQALALFKCPDWRKTVNELYAAFAVFGPITFTGIKRIRKQKQEEQTKQLSLL